MPLERDFDGTLVSYSMSYYDYKPIYPWGTAAATAVVARTSQRMLTRSGAMDTFFVCSVQLPPNKVTT